MRAECGHYCPQACRSQGRLTVPIDVCGAGVSFPVVVRVSLIGVVVVGAVVTAVSHIISVVVILGWVVMEWAVVLQKNGALYNTVRATSSGLQPSALHTTATVCDVFYLVLTAEVIKPGPNE